MSIKLDRLLCEYSYPEGSMAKVLRESRIAVGAIAVLVAAGSVVTAAPLVPVTMSMGATAITDVTPVQWRGRDGGAGVAAGLATGPIMGGQRSYEPFRPILTITRRDTADPSDMAVLTDRLIAFHAIGNSIRSAERIKVATATATIAGSSRF
jgi:hypothetical protein